MRPNTKRDLEIFDSMTIRLSYSRRYMPLLKDSWILQCCHLCARFLQEEIDLLQHTEGIVSAVTRSASRKRARPPSSSVAQERQGISSKTERKYGRASNSRAIEMCDENDRGIDSAAAISFGNLLHTRRNRLAGVMHRVGPDRSFSHQTTTSET